MTPPISPHPTAAEARQRFYDLVHAAEKDGQDTLLLATGGATVRLTAAPAGTDPAAYPGQTLKWAKAKLEELVDQAAAGQPVLLLRSGSIPVAILHAEPAPHSQGAPEPTAREGAAPAAPAAPVTTGGDVLASLAAAPEPIRFGLDALDEVTGGLHSGTVTVLAAEPHAGGALLAVAAARTTALHENRPTLYAATGGLSRPEVATRMVAAEAGADYRSLRQALATGADPGEDSVREAVAAATGAVTAAPLHLLDGPLTAEAITQAGTGIEGLALVVVDRLQHQVDPAAPLSGRGPLCEAVRLLTRCAREQNVAVLAVLDTIDPRVVGALNPDVCLTLTRDGERAQVVAAERDFGRIGHPVPLAADISRVRFLPAPAAETDTTAQTGAAAAADGKEDAPAQAQQSAPRQQGAKKPSGDGWPEGFQRPDPGERVRNAPVEEKIAAAVDEQLERADGDIEKAREQLERLSIRMVWHLHGALRGGDLGHQIKPPMPDILIKADTKTPDDIWEARPKWNHPRYRKLKSGEQPREGDLQVQALDINAAYLNAMHTHLPLGRLEHSVGRPTGEGDRRRQRAGFHLITPPAWEHPHLPNPLGNREEPGPFWVGEPTLRLLLELSSRRDLCAEPTVHESWTAQASESILDKVREYLNNARLDAIEHGDDLTKSWISDMYNKAVSTLIKSPKRPNPFLDRPDWAHLIRSAAFAALWRRACTAHAAGVIPVRVAQTDELHVIGDGWRDLWKEDKTLSGIKTKLEGSKRSEQYGQPVTYPVREVAA